MSRPNSKRVGDETEVAAIRFLLSEGYTVSIPFGDNHPYDLVVDDHKRLYRLQCKTAWSTGNGTIRFNTHSQTTKNGEYHERSYRGLIDGVLVRNPDTDHFYLIPEDHLTDQKMALRFTSDIDHPAINWAASYRFFGDLSPI